jgi:hypothetical protein
VISKREVREEREDTAANPVKKLFALLFLIVLCDAIVILCSSLRLCVE